MFLTGENHSSNFWQGKMMRKLTNIMVTGGAGFIGSNFVRVLLNDESFKGRVINVDKLTYAGNADSLNDVAAAKGDRYIFEHADICDAEENKRVVLPMWGIPL